MRSWTRYVCLVFILSVSLGRAEAGEVLYNGIELPEVWPPRSEKVTREPMPVPYREHRPEVVPIDRGRQLFVDDFLIEQTTLTRTYHTANYHPANPLLTADRPWESANDTFFAAPFSDGVWYDPTDRKFKLWYLAGDLTKTCYAESSDGIQWHKPKLPVVEGTNIVHIANRDSATLWLDHTATNPQHRFKAFFTESGKGWQLTYRTSGDGIRWSAPLAASSIRGDRTTVFYNPFRRVWCLSERINSKELIRTRAYLEESDPLRLIQKTTGNGKQAALNGSVPWLGADRLDPHHTDPRWQAIEPQLYNFDAVAYESLMLGLFTIWQGPENDVSRKLGNQKRNEVLLGFSRDGFHFSRPDRRPFLPCNEVKDAWNWGNVQSVGGGCLVVGDQLYFYVSGRALDASGKQGRMSTGLATLRRDGFASMNAAKQTGTLLTRPLTFKGSHLHVNTKCPAGELKAEVLNLAGEPIGPFTLENCQGVSTDATRVGLTWKNGDLAKLASQTVRLRFHLTNGSLYSFWVSAEATGASQGYIAAGGPGFENGIDE